MLYSFCLVLILSRLCFAFRLNFFLSHEHFWFFFLNPFFFSYFLGVFVADWWNLDFWQYSHVVCPSFEISAVVVIVETTFHVAQKLFSAVLQLLLVGQV